MAWKKKLLDDWGSRRSAQMKWDMIECIAAGVNKQVKLECSQLLFQSSWGGNSSFSGRSVGKIKGICSWAVAFLLCPSFFSPPSASFSSPAMHYPIQLLLYYVVTHHVYFSVLIVLSLHHLGPWAGLRIGNPFKFHTYTTHTVKVQLYHFTIINTQICTWYTKNLYLLIHRIKVTLIDTTYHKVQLKPSKVII